MKLKTFAKLTCVAVLFVFALALGAAVRADGISDSNTTTDGSSGTVNAGQGEVFTCQDSSNSFSCIDTSAFTCFGFDNCLALGATGGALTLGAFLEEYGSGPVQFTAGESPVTTPEPGILVLLTAGVLALVVFRGIAQPARNR